MADHNKIAAGIDVSKHKRLCRNTEQLADFGNEHALAEFNIGTTQHRDNLVNTITFLRHLKILSGLRPGWILS